MWLDRQRNVVVYDTPQADSIARSVPGAVRLHNGYVAAPATLYNYQLLSHLGMQVPAPLDEANYDWPGRFAPFLSQRITANFIVIRPRCFVLSDMGTGKTMAALWGADFVLRQYPGTRCLVVCPLSTMQRVWADAVFQNFMGRRKAVVLHGSAEKRLELLAQPADFYIINFDGLGVIAGALEARADIRMAIVDECSAYRDRTTKRHKLARKLLATKDYLWMMTGTPVPNGPLDAYGMAKLVNNAFGESYMNYQMRTMTKVSMFKRVPKTGSHAAAMKLLQPAIRFSISDCVDLPPLLVQKRDVELSPEQTKAFKVMKRDLVLMAKKGPITAPNEAVLRGKLIQIACGAVYGPDKAVHKLDCGPRLQALREVVQEAGAKIIVFAPLRSVLQLIYSELSSDYTCAMVHGDTSPKERAEIFRAFEQDENPRIIVADPGTMAHGVTLVAASVVLWFAPTDKTELYLQANKRFHRPGQNKACFVVQLAATPIEREIYRRLEANESLQGLMLKMVEEGHDAERA